MDFYTGEKNGCINEKLLIIHLDDMGMSYAANQAGMDMLKKGAASSASIIMPAAPARDFVKWCTKNPQYDIGIHSALTCEWDVFRWGALSQNGSGLSDDDGFMCRTTAQVFEKADVEMVEGEIRAQIESALKLGLKPSHLDNHMWFVQKSPDLFKMYIDIAREYKLVAHIPENSLYNEEMIILLEKSGMPKVRSLPLKRTKTYKEKKEDIYEAVKSIQCGINILTLHPVIETDEIKQIIPEWENRYFEYLTMMDDVTARIIVQNDVKVVDWRMIRESCNNV